MDCKLIDRLTLAGMSFLQLCAFPSDTIILGLPGLAAAGWKYVGCCAHKFLPTLLVVGGGHFTQSAGLDFSGGWVPGRIVASVMHRSIQFGEFRLKQGRCDGGCLRKKKAADGMLRVRAVACSSPPCLHKRSKGEGERVRTGPQYPKLLEEAVVKKLFRCESVQEALQVFYGLPQRTVFSWTAIIARHARSGQYNEALRMYRRMQQAGVKPNKYTLVTVLKACSKLANLKEGKRIHFHLLNLNCKLDLVVGNTLVSMYAKCGSLSDAREIFDTLCQRDVVSWNVMLAGYAQQQRGEDALRLYGLMQEEGVVPDDRTFVSVLKACGSLAAEEEETLVDGLAVKLESLWKGKVVHAQVVNMGYQVDSFVSSTVIHMYTSCGCVVDAQQVFDSLSWRNTVSWNAMIAGYTQHEQAEKALQLYNRMEDEAVRPDNRTFVSVVKACGILAASDDVLHVDGQLVKLNSLRKGKQTHAEALSEGYESDIFVCNTLVDMYSKCGSILDARLVFDTLPYRDVVTWNAMIAGCTLQEQGDTALQLYGRMEGSGVKPDDRTFVNVLKACGSLAVVEKETVIDGVSVRVDTLHKVKEVHHDVAGRGYGSDIFVGSTLLHTYANCGSIADAQRLFEVLCHHHVVLWNAMIAGYNLQEQGAKALRLYGQMRERGVRPDETTFLCILKACSSMGALNMTAQIHRDVLECGLGWSLSVRNTLIHAYGNCGSMKDAQTVFDSLLHERDIVSWNALIAGYARQGECDKSLHCFDGMRQMQMRPDGVTFVSLLSAYSHSGVVETGLECFLTMTREHAITAATEHYVSLIDLLGRAGLFSQAEHLMSTMPTGPHSSVWLSLLSACRKHHNVELGRRAFEHVVCLDPKRGGAYMMMSNMYTQAYLWDDAKEIEELRVQAGAPKKLGQSWIEYNEDVVMFAAGDRSHQQTPQVYAKLEELSVEMKERGIDLLYATL